jgi:hypothetical protein
MPAGEVAGLGWSVQEFGLFRLLAMAASVSLACGIFASGAQALCRVEITACNIACPDPAGNKTTCKRKCHTILCERDSKRLAKSQMPASELPGDELPLSHVPDDRLPDSAMN